MSIDESTLEYDNNRGTITGSVNVEFYFNDYAKQATVSFNNELKHKRNDLRIVEAKLGDGDLFALTDADDWAGYEDEIANLIEELETPKEPEFNGYGYNGSDTQ